MFTEAKRKIKRAQKRRNEKVNVGKKVVELGVGAPMYYRVHLREEKLDQRWEPYYRIVEKMCLVLFLIWD